MKVISILFVFVLSVIVTDMAVNSLSFTEATDRLKETLFVKAIFTYQDINTVQVNIPIPDSYTVDSTKKVIDSLLSISDSLIGVNEPDILEILGIEKTESTTITDK